MRYLSTTLAAYVGESIAIRYDPRDLGEIRVFHQDRFLCRVISAELAGEVVTLREIVRARNRRRRELRTTIENRQAAVDTLLEFRRGQVLEEVCVDPPIRAAPAIHAFDLGLIELRDAPHFFPATAEERRQAGSGSSDGRT